MFPCAAYAVTPDDPGPGDVAFTVDAGQDVHAISPYIYGSNQYISSITNAGMARLGGNRWTGYNWETNASNAGHDWYYHSDNYLGAGAPGNAVLPTLQDAAAGDYATVVTLPMAGYVAADTNGTVDETEVAPSPRWHAIEANKSTIYPGSQLSLNPNLGDGYVFTDEFVNWVENARQAGQAVFYSLDNEPGLWGETLPPGWDTGQEPVPCCDPADGVDPSEEGRTHGALHPYEPTFAEMRTRTIAHAGAIKDFNPDAVVFGGIGYGYNEFTTLQDAPDAVTTPAHPGGDQPGELHYYEWLLNEIAQEEATQGRTLVDVLDLHWYPEATGGDVRITGNDNHPAVAAARVQAPRSLWDPTYTETSWITQWATQGPIELLPRLQRDIDDFKPGTRIAITEYNYGGTNHISGAIAQADFLGVMGRYDVFAASWWALDNEANSDFALGAFEMFLNYDGSGARFGDTSVEADTDSIAESAVYASTDTSDPNRMVLVAINRTDSPLDAAIAVTADVAFDLAEVYQLTAASATPVRAADIGITLTNAFIYEMPAYSVSTIVLRNTTPIVPGDADGDGDVDLDDYNIMSGNMYQPVTGGAAEGDFNGDGVVNFEDFVIQSLHFGEGAADETADDLPEPTTIAIFVLGLSALLRRRFTQ